MGKNKKKGSQQSHPESTEAAISEGLESQIQEAKEKVQNLEVSVTIHEQKLNVFRHDFSSFLEQCNKIDQLAGKKEFKLAAKVIREALEAVCKSLYNYYGCAPQNSNTPPDKLTLGPLSQSLGKVGAKEKIPGLIPLPEIIKQTLRYATEICNTACHDQGSENQTIDEDCFKAALETFNIIRLWYLKNFYKEPFLNKIKRKAWVILLLVILVGGFYGGVHQSLYFYVENYINTNNLPQKQVETIAIQNSIGLQLEGKGAIDIEKLYKLSDNLTSFDKSLGYAAAEQIHNRWKNWLFGLKLEDLKNSESAHLVKNQINFVTRRFAQGALNEDSLTMARIDDLLEYFANESKFSEVANQRGDLESQFSLLTKLAKLFKDSGNSFIKDAEIDLINLFISGAKQFSLFEQYTLFNRMSECYQPGSTISQIIKGKINETAQKIEEATPDLIKKVTNGKAESLYESICKGENINIQDPLGNTALHYAAQLGKKNWIRLLLAYGADPTIVNSEKLLPVDLCPSSSERNFFVSEVEEASSFFLVNRKEGAHLQETPQNNSRSIRHLPFGVPVKVVSETVSNDKTTMVRPGKWLKVSFGENHGWVYESLLTRGNHLTCEVLNPLKIDKTEFLLINETCFPAPEKAQIESRQLLHQGHMNLVLNLKDFQSSKSDNFAITFASLADRKSAENKLLELQNLGLPAKLIEISLFQESKESENATPEKETNKAKASTERKPSPKANSVKKAPSPAKIIPQVPQYEKPVIVPRPSIRQVAPKNIDLKGLSELLKHGG